MKHKLTRRFTLWLNPVESCRTQWGFINNETWVQLEIARVYAQGGKALRVEKGGMVAVAVEVNQV